MTIDLNLHVTLDPSERFFALLSQFLRPVIITIAGELRFSGLQGDEMADYVIPNDTPDGTYTLPTVTVKDAEGETITEGVEQSFASTDPEVFSVADGNYHVGHSGVATVNFVVTYRGEPVFSDAANITVTTGAFGQVETSGGVTFSGLTPSE